MDSQNPKVQMWIMNHGCTKPNEAYKVSYVQIDKSNLQVTCLNCNKQTVIKS